MKNTTRLFLFLPVIITGIFLSAGCSKDEDEPGSFYMRFDANGNKVEYVNQLGLTAGFAQNENMNVGTISGWNDASSSMGLLLYDSEPIKEGTMSGYKVSDGAVVGVLLAYREKETGIVFSSGASIDFDGTVTITEMNDNIVKGTFHGKVVATGQQDILITDGSFQVKRVLN